MTQELIPVDTQYFGPISYGDSPPERELKAKIARATLLLSNPKKDTTNPFLKNRYASLGSVIDTIKTTLGENGIGFVQECQEENGILDVSTHLIDAETGADIKFNVSIHLKELSPQGSAGAFTYGRRYALLALFGLAPEDDDANEASGRTQEAESVLKKAAELAKSTKKSGL